MFSAEVVNCFACLAVSEVDTGILKLDTTDGECRQRRWATAVILRLFGCLCCATQVGPVVLAILLALQVKVQALENKGVHFQFFFQQW